LTCAGIQEHYSHGPPLTCDTGACLDYIVAGSADSEAFRIAIDIADLPLAFAAVTFSDGSSFELVVHPRASDRSER
jgi:hypothetical protein